MLGWESFQSALFDGIYCFDTIPSNSINFLNLALGECEESEVISGTDFIREVELAVLADEVKVVAVVKWLDAGVSRQATVEQTFKKIN